MPVSQTETTRTFVLPRVYMGEGDRHDGRPLREAVVAAARAMKLSGATVPRGVMGYGRSNHVRCAKILRLSLDLRLVVEIIDRAQAVDAFLPVLDDMMEGGLVTLETVRVLR